MGMYDYVNFSMPCPECDEEITEWQSKDSVCQLSVVDPQAVSVFYGACEKCLRRLTFLRQAPSPARSAPYTEEEVRAMGFIRSDDE